MKLSNGSAELARLVAVAVTAVASPLWGWSADHLPMWASFLVLIAILLAFWHVVAHSRREERRRERERRRRSIPLW